MKRPGQSILVVCIGGALALGLAGCPFRKGKKDKADTASAAASASAAAQKARAAAEGGEDPEKECRIQARCEHKCRLECAAEERDRTAFFEAKRRKVGQSPFQVKIEQAYFKGSCASGGDPAKRKDPPGLAAVVTGKLTYTGKDLLFHAEPKGSVFLRFGKQRYAEAPVEGERYSLMGRKKISKLLRSVRGADPWVSGQTRTFYWESKPVNPAFCEVMPDRAEAYISLATGGIHGAKHEYPIHFVPLAWHEVVGMALGHPKLEVLVRKGTETVREPVKGHFSRLDRMLVTRGEKTEWVSREAIIQAGNLTKGAGTKFPVEASSSEWKVTVTSISGAREFGGYTPKGEGEFVAMVDVGLKYQAWPSEAGDEPPVGRPRGFSARLETSPGKWRSQERKAEGQLELPDDMYDGETIKGKLVFVRQRFERPFRLEIKTPDRKTLYLNVLSYALGPERAPK